MLLPKVELLYPKIPEPLEKLDDVAPPKREGVA